MKFIKQWRKNCICSSFGNHFFLQFIRLTSLNFFNNSVSLSSFEYHFYIISWLVCSKMHIAVFSWLNIGNESKLPYSVIWCYQCYKNATCTASLWAIGSSVGFASAEQAIWCFNETMRQMKSMSCPNLKSKVNYANFAIK